METATISNTISAEDDAAMEAMMSLAAKAKEERLKRSGRYFERGAVEANGNKFTQQKYLAERMYNATGKPEWNPYR